MVETAQASSRCPLCATAELERLGVLAFCSECRLAFTPLGLATERETRALRNSRQAGPVPCSEPELAETRA